MTDGWTHLGARPRARVAARRQAPVDPFTFQPQGCGAGGGAAVSPRREGNGRRRRCQPCQPLKKGRVALVNLQCICLLAQPAHAQHHPELSDRTRSPGPARKVGSPAANRNAVGALFEPQGRPAAAVTRARRPAGGRWPGARPARAPGEADAQPLAASLSRWPSLSLDGPKCPSLARTVPRHANRVTAPQGCAPTGPRRRRWRPPSSCSCSCWLPPCCWRPCRVPRRTATSQTSGAASTPGGPPAPGSC
jgi:hypothetical protein